VDGFSLAWLLSTALIGRRSAASWVATVSSALACR
jgi:hypothetical protein